MFKTMSILLFSLFLVSTAPAHEWYDPLCCSDKDCHPIASCSELVENKDGSISWNKYKFHKNSIKPSQDKNCHVCISPELGAMCVYTV